MERIAQYAREHMKRTGRGIIITFRAPVHGMGASFVADHAADVFKAYGLSVLRISAGDVFREMAERAHVLFPQYFERPATVETFSKRLTELEELAVRVDTELDKILHTRAWDGTERYHVVVADSTVLPFLLALAGYTNVYNVLLWADPQVVGQRLVGAKRKAERRYKDPEEAFRAQVERMRADLERYRRVAREIKDSDPFMARVYESVASTYAYLMSRLDKRPPVVWPFHAVADNSGHVDETLADVEEGFVRRHSLLRALFNGVYALLWGLGF